jgi:hypothetical protein
MNNKIIKYILIFNMYFIDYLPGQNTPKNLVLNPSFEINLGCPSTLGQIGKAKGWFEADSGIKMSSDYFNSCSSNPDYIIPYTGLGYQNPRSGNAFGGFFLYSRFKPNYPQKYICEYISGSINKLQNNKNYSVVYYINKCNQSHFGTLDTFVSINKCGLRFSSDSLLFNSDVFNTKNYFSYNKTPHIEHKGALLSDTLNWMEIKGVYKASGNEKYFTIGNFYPDSLTQTDPYQWGNKIIVTSYYFLDDVSVVELPTIQFKRSALKDSVCQGDSLRWGISTNLWWPKMKLGLYNAQNQLLKTVYDSSLSFKPTVSGKYYLKLLYDSAAQYAPAFDEAGFVDSTNIFIKSEAACLVGFEDVLADAEKIDLYFADGKIIFKNLHERFAVASSAAPSATVSSAAPSATVSSAVLDLTMEATLQMKAIDGKIIFKTPLIRKQNEYTIGHKLQKGFYFVEVIYQGQSIKRKKVLATAD